MSQDQNDKKQADDVAGFEQQPTSLVEREVGAVAAVAREEAELKGAIVAARHFPRNEADAYARLIKSARRPSFAEGARYSFPRGGTRVEGPSVKMAREMARCWGNLRYGLRVVSMDEKYVHIKGWALDLETNDYVEMEDKFEKLVFRKKSGWTKPDERDLRELINRRGAICIRNAILQVMPPDVVDEMMLAVQDTMLKAAKGEVEQDREQAVRRIVSAFAEFGVKSAMIEDYLGHDLETITADELADLRGVYTAIRDGQAKAAEFFRRGREASQETAELNAAAKAAASNKPESKDEPDENSDTNMDDFAQQSAAQLDIYAKQLDEITTKAEFDKWKKQNKLSAIEKKLLPEHFAQLEGALEDMDDALG